MNGMCQYGHESNAESGGRLRFDLVLTIGNLIINNKLSDSLCFSLFYRDNLNILRRLACIVAFYNAKLSRLSACTPGWDPSAVGHYK